MKINQPLDQLFANEARSQILRTLFKFPGEFTGRHIARLCHLPHATARLNLIAFEESNMLNVKHIGKSKVYSLNANNVLYQPLAALFEAEQAVKQELEQKLNDTLLSDVAIRNALAHASLYGIVVKGDERPCSDIDVLLIFKREIDKNHLDQILEPLEDDISKSFGKQLHVMLIECKANDNKWRDLLRPTFVQKLSQHSKLLYGKSIEEVLAACQKKQKRSHEEERFTVKSSSY